MVPKKKRSNEQRSVISTFSMSMSILRDRISKESLEQLSKFACNVY